MGVWSSASGELGLSMLLFPPVINAAPGLKHKYLLLDSAESPLVCKLAIIVQAMTSRKIL